MKKKLLISLIALMTLVGVTGTLFYVRNSKLVAQETLEKKEQEAALIMATTTVDEVTPPKITGQKNWEITQGEQINVLTGVTAKDTNNKEVSVTASHFSTDKLGDQAVFLTAEDESDHISTKVITIHVKAPAVKKDKSTKQATADSTNLSDAPPAVEAPISEELEAPVVKEEVAVEPQPVKISEPTWTPNTMYVGGLDIAYENAGQGSGQAIIDGNPNVIATWGGTPVQSGIDGANTHFIGHNPGIFGVLFSLTEGSQITVTDSAGIPTNYTVNQLIQVDDYATGIADGQSYADAIIGSGGGERITLQTCINDDVNLIVMASAA